MTSNTQRFEIQRHSSGKGWSPFENEGWADARNDLRFIACDGQKTHLHDYRATRIPINIPLCVFLGVGTARGAKEPRSAVYALHPSVFPQALCHHVRGSPSESPLPGSKQAQRQEPCASIDAPCGRPAAPQVRKRQPRKKKRERKKWGRSTRGRAHGVIEY